MVDLMSLHPSSAHHARRGDAGHRARAQTIPVEEHNPAHSRRLAVLLLLFDAAQIRWNVSTPRTQRPPKNAVPLATMVVGLTKRPDHLVVTLQSDVQFRDV
jgi:hypothetical protein